MVNIGLRPEDKMNAERRKKIEKLVAELEDIKEQLDIKEKSNYDVQA